MAKKKFRLATVLRARQAKEDAVRGEVLAARAALREAELEAERAGETLRGRQLPAEAVARSYVAAISARQALAGELSAAHRVTEAAQEAVAAKLREYTEASAARRAVEKLKERHAAERAAAELAEDQQLVDELATTRRSRGKPPMESEQE
ncbi:flagellar FliJ family protein [Cryptosporangium phraense]|uniref:Flagellar FliJ protein n=1 Tax=Cryptosporangium phraense TaxID=2593070 RepID=A0A545AED0_9ACTN|nr:flagellar FliJ family protein [Cryptosporangium phraense]TQS39684.1 cell envelope biogenesis protein TolA [Cryptosporangium phraense]